eukprot:TRINITY_DN12137_c0_g8_i1.p1 TRINITY_DN12137_c0_g8~~TRINITY_DN12137_c0_g8_i1.p1  ORF type:complete len:197 (+),score=31.12 TRINITY_DN12137_c0_g8_i1:71-661(+)
MCIRDRYKAKESLKARATEHCNNRLQAKTILALLSLLVQRHKENEENDSMRSNVDNSGCFTFVKKNEKTSCEEIPRVGEFLSTNATLPNASSNTTRKLNKVLEDVAHGSTNIRAKDCSERLPQSSRESCAEEPCETVAFNYYKQTTYSKGMLGLLHFRQRMLQLERVSEDFALSRTCKNLDYCLKRWKERAGILSL